MDCFRKVIKNAEQIIKDSKNLYLFANLLNKYLYYYSIDADFITFEDINNLLKLIKEYVDEAQPEDIKDTLKYLKNTKEAIKARQFGDQG